MCTVSRRILNSIPLGLLWAAGCGGAALAYERQTHQQVTESAVLASYLGDPKQRARLGIRYPVAETSYAEQIYMDSKSTRSSVMTLIKSGSDWEDDIPPGPTTHFFDPRTGEGLFLNPSDYSSELFLDPLDAEAAVWIGTLNLLSVPSPRWVVEGKGATKIWPGWPTENTYSIARARDYLYRGLTHPTPRTRRENMGLMFESLGRMVHHIQDMAQPQHARNDGHLSDGSVDGKCANPLVAVAIDVMFLKLCEAYRRLRRFSSYEAWTDGERVLKSLPKGGYAPVYPGIVAPDGTFDGVRAFSKPDQFWKANGMGIAEFTGRNFLSQGTLDRSPPETGTPYDVTLDALCGSTSPPCELMGPYPADASVTFYPSVVDDRFRPGGPSAHPYAKSNSIFNPELSAYVGYRMYTVNRFTFAVDHQYLIPRAVAYSAGLINYFFRGDMEVTPPDEGIYAAVDMSTSGCGTPCGFRWIRTKIRNTTPGAEPMGQGHLVAVARFHRNKCFKPDLSGNYDVLPFERSCRLPAEEIVVSASRPVKAGEIDTSQAREFAFDFSTNPIPIEASDLDIQVIFRGTLGEEVDVVALRTVDIAEPNFLGMLNVMDYVFDVASGKYFDPGTFGAVKRPVTNLTLRLRDGTPPVGTLPQLDAGRYARVAILTSRGKVSGTVLASRGDIPFDLDVREFGLDANDRYVRTCPVRESRGLYWEFLFFYPQIRDEYGTIALRDEGETGIDRAVAMARQLSHAKATCGDPSGGVFDMSTMTPLGVAQAIPFTLADAWKVPPPPPK